MTNNTDGAALLPVTPDACPFCGGEGLPHRVATGWRVSCKNCDAQPRPGFPSDNEAEAIAAWNTRAPLPATQEDAERSGAGDVENLRSALRPFARAWQYWSDLKRLKPDADGVEEGPKGFVIWSEFKAAYEALSTPQRQEYDGEAVREALEQNRGPLADAARQIAVRFGVGGEGQASAYAAAKDAILAALAHPAQARDEMLPDWIYDIQWGPEGQQDYAHVYDRASNLVAVMKTHHAAMVAKHRGALSSDKVEDR